MDLPLPQPACIALVPVLLSPTPRTIPGSQLSQLTRSAHHYLSTPVTSPAYLQPVQVDYEVTRLRDELTESISDPHLGDPLYAADASAIRALIPLGSSSLAVVLVWEEAVHPHGGAFAGLGNEFSSAFAPSDDQDEQGLAGWRFLTLDRIDPDSPSAKHWSPDLRTALDGLSRQLSEGISAAGTGGSMKKKSAGMGPMTIKTPKIPVKSREEMAEGEGTTPGAYGAPEDFWEGWEEEDDHSEGGRGGDYPSGAPSGSVGRAYNTRPLSFKEKEAAQESSYWESYGSDASGSVIGDDDGANDHTRTNSHHHEESDAQLLPMDADDPDFVSISRRASAVARASPITRSRRSSTIRAADAPVVMGALGLAGATRPDPSRTSSTTAPSTIGTTTKETSPTGSPDSEEEKTTPTLPTSSPDVEALCFALAGVWQLFTKGSNPTERDQQRDTFLRVANTVTKS